MTMPLFEEDVTRRMRPDGVTSLKRAAFAEDFPYKKGEHVVFGGPTTRGKTTLAFDLMAELVSERFPAFVALSKPRDPVTLERSQALGFRIVSEWPPPVKVQEMAMFGGKKPPGYLIYPPFGDLDRDMEVASTLTRRLLMERYAAGASEKSKPGILVMDDTMVKAKIMGLDKEMVTILAMAGAMGIGLWIFVQKPTDSGRTTLWGYENATHLFFTKGGDAQMLRRYAEIAGDHGALLKKVLPTLGPFEFVYIHKNEGYFCVVEAS